MKEENVWKDFPSEHDKYAGWAKRMGELQVEAYSKEYTFNGLHVVRPANIYGPHLNFNPKNSMVVASLIKRIIDNENPLIVWGDGSCRICICEDVANYDKSCSKKYVKPINIGSGKGTTIKKLLLTILNSKYISNKSKIIFDTKKQSGDKKRVLDTKLAKKFKINNSTSLKIGIDKTIKWYLNNKDQLNKKYNHFSK